jgi:hypothetical protein
MATRVKSAYAGERKTAEVLQISVGCIKKLTMLASERGVGAEARKFRQFPPRCVSPRRIDLDWCDDASSCVPCWAGCRWLQTRTIFIGRSNNDSDLVTSGKTAKTQKRKTAKDKTFPEIAAPLRARSVPRLSRRHRILPRQPPSGAVPPVHWIDVDRHEPLTSNRYILAPVVSAQTDLLKSRLTDRTPRPRPLTLIVYRYERALQYYE